MVFLRNKNKAPAPEQIAESAHVVIETVKDTGLDPEHTLIMGGSALALAGIRPAHDVDIIVPQSVFYRTAAHDFALPSGIRLRHKSHSIYPVMETYDRQPDDRLHVDITTAKRDYGDDQNFLEEIEQYDAVQGFRYLPPNLVAQRKLRSERRRRKDDEDIELIQQHLERMRQR
jgi:hypothetical protein